MPPILPRKRLRTPSPQPPPPQKRTASSRKNKPDVFTTFDSHSKKAPSAAETKAFLDALSDEQSSLSEAESDEFEDVIATPAPKRQKVAQNRAEHVDSDDELEFEDVAAPDEQEEYAIPEILEDLSVTVREPGEVGRLTLIHGGKASITKKMRAARIRAHCMHVQFLLWHNVIRNSWINDAEVQLILLRGLPEPLKAEVTKWKIAMGLEKPERKTKSKKGTKGKAVLQKSGRERIRDWGADAEKSEHNVQGDPLIRLLKYLAAYWKKRFRVTAPSLRKLGYRNPRDMRDEMDSFNDGRHDPARHGERIADLGDFRELAKKCQGSRDVGAQLFTALLRGLGIEARLVVSLQPTGFGWSKNEEAHSRKAISAVTTDTGATDSEPAKASTKEAFSKNTRKGTSSRPIRLDPEDSSGLSSPPSSDSDNGVSAAPSVSKSNPPRFDRDLLYPTNWTEVLSPVSNTYIPISTMLHPNVVTSPEHTSNFEPRGAAAEKAKQVISYVVAFSSDGTAKDITVRYLRKRQWPGKTKGFRIPIEKLPLYNRNGKVARYEEYDWFKRVIRGYARPGDRRTLADDIEDEGDLVPVRPETDEKKKSDPETLQGYKQSADFVLERHLRREEALLPGSEPVKHFHVGKGEKAAKEAVYKRSCVVIAKSVETWHKEGRQVQVGEQALKQVPYRAVTLIRKREIEDQARDMGQKPTQGLYAEYQTEWIIPNPIGPDRNIPKNVFGNIDVYVPSMIPKGAVHIPLRSTAKVCKRLGIDFAEACTGFEFGKQRAVPVLTGVVVAEENEDLIIDAWEEDERLRREKENKKKEELILGLWKKFLRGMRIRERMRKEYGATDDEAQELDEGQHWAGKGRRLSGLRNGDEREQGGFLHDEDDGTRSLRASSDTGGAGGFLLESSDDEAGYGGGGFEIIGDSQDPKKRKRFRHSDYEHKNLHEHMPMPISLQAMHTTQMDLDGGGEALTDGRVEGETRNDGDEEEREVSELGPRCGSDDADLDEFALKPKSRTSSRTSSSKAKITGKESPASARKTRPLVLVEAARTRRSSRYPAPTGSPYFSH
jgi:xeroderma pigmentosum group C-complementing protein